MTTVIVSQPMYFPWAGFIGQMALADVYIWLDDVQFSKGSFTNRVQVKSPAGQSWMTIPLVGKGAFQPIADLAALDEKWRVGHRDLLRQQLKGLPHFKEAVELFDTCLAEQRLVDVLIASAERPAAFLNALPPTILKSSDMAISGSSTERVLKLVEAVGGTRYVTGHGAARYFDHEMFERAGIAVDYMCYDMPAWPQLHGAFTPYVTILDMVAALGRGAAAWLPAETIGWRHFLEERERNHA